jgi:hypothetical protein
MVDKEPHLQRFKELYRRKNGRDIPDDLALEYFEKLITLVETITEHLPAKEIIIPRYEQRK